ncbi:hypothetical protein ALP65_00209 [Pseudomonas aeruginosa]|uniref:Pyruvate kinase n=28 Tax=Gammaproteobacteria TaxID=1236 RepID=A0A3M5DP23_PSEAI|nr:hypothetical protein ALP65_00209 [Pseudomonas aeruginosa]
MLDVPVLLAAVSPDSPCGDDLEYDAAFLELERIAQGQPERQMGDAVLPAEPPEWPRVRALASELFGRSKDLRVANLLLQSNVALDGLDGLADGLLLVRELLGQYWDGVYPLLDADDDNDPTFRINALTGLVAEPLLQLVWAIPLVRSRAFGPVNLRAALNAAGLQRFASETLSPEQIAGAFADADADALAATRRALEGALEHALAIESGVAERVGSAQGLDLGPLRQLLRQALQVFDLYGPQGADESLAPGAEAVADDDALDGLIRASDAVMVARGDLGVEIGDAELVGIQKKIILHARRNNKVVITATQMMESMIHSPMPTRAEVSDVANAVLDYTDAVMLSAESAAGEYPVEAVKAMARVCQGAEKHPTSQKSSHRLGQTFDRCDESIALASMYTANHFPGIKAIICLTESGFTPLIMSRIRSSVPIYAYSPHRETQARVAMFRGVETIPFDPAALPVEKVSQAAVDELLKRGVVTKGDWVILTKGDSYTAQGGTNTMKVLHVGDLLV